MSAQVMPVLPGPGPRLEQHDSREHIAVAEILGFLFKPEPPAHPAVRSQQASCQPRVADRTDCRSTGLGHGFKT